MQPWMRGYVIHRIIICSFLIDDDELKKDSGNESDNSETEIQSVRVFVYIFDFGFLLCKCLSDPHSFLISL